MKMSDKDFDQLFNSKLGNMEMEPPAKVWKNITGELDGKQKSKGMPFMRIAATIVVIMGVGLVFIRPQTAKIELRASATAPADITDRGEPARPTQEPAIDPGTITEASTEAPVKYQPKRVVATYAKASTSTAKHPDIETTTDNPVASEPTVTAMSQSGSSSPKETVTQTGTTSAPETKSTILANIDQGKINTDAANKNAINPNNAKLALVPINQMPKNNTGPAKKKRIHSLGDLLNVVIAKVDKREDKLIEFTNTSDDDSFNVTGINLGLIHAKKEN